MTFASLALICLVALLGPILSLPRLARVPVVIGELLVGLALGVSGINVLPSADPTFSFLAEIGFGLVMFVAGSHLPVRQMSLRTGVAAGASRAVTIVALAIPVAVAISQLFGTGNWALYVVILASSSAAVVIPALPPRSLTHPTIVAMIPQVVLADAACIIALPLVVDPANVTQAVIGSAAVIGASGVVYVFLRWAQRSGKRRQVHQLSKERALAIELRASLTILFALAAIAAETRVSILLAGFSMGVTVALVGEPRRLSKQLFALTEGFFGPIFFVWLGSSINIKELGERPAAIGLGVVLGLAAIAVHAVMTVTGQPLPVAAMTSAQLGVPVAAAAMGTQLHILAPGETSALLLGALITLFAATAASGRVDGMLGGQPTVTAQPDRPL